MTENFSVPVETLVAHWKAEVSRVHQALTERAVEAELIAASLQTRVRELEQRLAEDERQPEHSAPSNSKAD